MTFAAVLTHCRLDSGNSVGRDPRCGILNVSSPDKIHQMAGHRTLGAVQVKADFVDGQALIKQFGYTGWNSN